MHAGRQDVPLLRREWRTDVRNVFDTQVAAGFAGRRAQLGYEALLGELLGVRLRKSASFTRWDQRPLSEEQVGYAREDVLHLLQLTDALQERARGPRPAGLGPRRVAGAGGRHRRARRRRAVRAAAARQRPRPRPARRRARARGLARGDRPRAGPPGLVGPPGRAARRDRQAPAAVGRAPRPDPRPARGHPAAPRAGDRRGRPARPRAAADPRRGRAPAAARARRRAADRARGGDRARPGRPGGARLRAARLARGPAEGRHRARATAPRTPTCARCRAGAARSSATSCSPCSTGGAPCASAAGAGSRSRRYRRAAMRRRPLALAATVARRRVRRRGLRLRRRRRRRPPGPGGDDHQGRRAARTSRCAGRSPPPGRRTAFDGDGAVDLKAGRARLELGTQLPAAGRRTGQHRLRRRRRLRPHRRPGRPAHRRPRLGQGRPRPRPPAPGGADLGALQGLAAGGDPSQVLALLALAGDSKEVGSERVDGVRRATTPGAWTPTRSRRSPTPTCAARCSASASARSRSTPGSTTRAASAARACASPPTAPACRSASTSTADLSAYGLRVDAAPPAGRLRRHGDRRDRGQAALRRLTRQRRAHAARGVAGQRAQQPVAAGPAQRDLERPAPAEGGHVRRSAARGARAVRRPRGRGRPGRSSSGGSARGPARTDAR